MKYALVITLLLGACVVTWLGYTSFLMPESEAQSSWFQRSGSISMVLVLIADALLVSKATSVFPGDQTVVIDSPSKKEQFIFQLLTVIALVFTALSTVISGYGDILWFYT